jgi:hypothetical protein
MAQIAPLSLPQSLELGGIRIVGASAAKTFAHLKTFLQLSSHSGFPKLEQPVEALLDAASIPCTDASWAIDGVTVLDLLNIAHVRHSYRLSGQIAWISLQNPHLLAGRLVQGFRGVYFERKTHEVIYAGPQGLEVYRPTEQHTVTQELLAAICIARESGIPEEAVRFALELQDKGAEIVWSPATEIRA